jgi:hypothetical protein
MNKAKIILFTLWVLIAMPVMLYAAGEKNDTQYPEAGFWMSLSDTDKRLFVTGMLMGIDTFLQSQPVLDVNADTSSAISGTFTSTFEFLSPDITVDEIIKSMDGFYSDKKNSRIPISEIYRIICAEAYVGFAKVDLDKDAYLDALRKKYAK